MDSIPCNVVLLPSEGIATSAIELSNQLKNRDVLFTLEDGKFYPHVSVYMLQLKLSDIAITQELLASIACHSLPLELDADNYEASMQFLDAEYIKINEISSLQLEVVTALNPLRDGLRKKDLERMHHATGLALENFQRYGWNTIGELYRPHMTLTRFKTDPEIASLILPDVHRFSGTFPKLGLFEMGDNGTCVRKIAEYKFGVSGQVK